MEQQKKNKKVGVIIIICTTVLITVLGAAVVFPFILAKMNIKTPVLTQKKYVTEYDLEYGKTEYKAYKNWNVSKVQAYDGSKYLDIWHSGDKVTSREHLTFRVFDSSSQAKRAYKKMYESYQDYRGVEEEGDNWFAGWEPDVYDASFYSMVYIEDNVLIMAELEGYSEWPEPWPEDDDSDNTSEPVNSGYDRSYLKDYVINHSEELKDYVLDTILEG